MIVGNNARLIIVDDEECIQNNLKDFFEFKGYVVRTAANGLEALKLLEQETADVIISDIMMPEMNGIELLRELNINHPMIRTIIITGHVTLDNLLAAFRLGAEKCIYKPIVELEELNKAVEDAVENLQDWENKLRELSKLKGVK